MVAAITSNLAQRGTGVDISTSQLDEGSLVANSHVRSDKVYTLSKSIVVRRFGRLNTATFRQVLEKLDVVLGR